MSSKKAQAAKKKGKTANGANPNHPTLAGHSRAYRSVQLAKSYAGLGAFALAGYSSWHAGATFVDVATRSLMWGVAAYVLVWALGVQVWRHVIIAEVRAAEKRWRERKAAEEEQVRKLKAAMDESGVGSA